MRKPQGIILWEGRSKIDGKPTMAILTGLRDRSDNTGTGPMLQVWILRRDLDPVEAMQTGQDRSICGDCPLRKVACYVRLDAAPAAVYKAYHRGSYEHYQPARHDRYLRGQAIRFGAYGDPTLIPQRLIKRLAGLASLYTGYSHQWWEDWAQPYRRWLMASTHSPLDSRLAQSLGWRVFESTAAEEARPRPGFIVCPKSKPEYDPGYRQCIDCGACDGSRHDNDSRVSVLIAAHAAEHRLPAVRKVLLSLV